MISILEQFDVGASLFLRSLVMPDTIMAKIIPFTSDLGVLVFSAFLVMVWFYGVYKKNVGYKIISLDMFYGVMLAFALYWILQFGLPARPRPETLSSIPPLIAHLPDNSFPSGHAIFSGAAVVVTGYFLNMRVSTAFAVLFLIMVLSRVIAGVHYFGDVFVGVILGALFARAWIYIRDRIGLKTSLHTIPIKIAAYIKL